MARGRKKGTKNLKREGKYIINQYGVKFTEQDKKKLESLVGKANRKRKKILEDEQSMERLIAGVPQGYTIKDDFFSPSSDFIIRKKTKSLQRFKSREEFNRYLRSIRKVIHPTYMDRKMKSYKKNFIKGIQNVFGADSDDLVKMIRKMDLKDYVRMSQQDEIARIEYIYSPEDYEQRLRGLTLAVERFAKL